MEEPQVSSNVSYGSSHSSMIISSHSKACAIKKTRMIKVGDYRRHMWYSVGTVLSAA